MEMQQPCRTADATKIQGITQTFQEDVYLQMLQNLIKYQSLLLTPILALWMLYATQVAQHT